MKKKRKYVKRVCSMCPKWSRGCCSFIAKLMVANHPVCDYGRKLITNDASRKWMAAKRKCGRRRKMTATEIAHAIRASIADGIIDNIFEKNKHAEGGKPSA